MTNGQTRFLKVKKVTFFETKEVSSIILSTILATT